MKKLLNYFPIFFILALFQASPVDAQIRRLPGEDDADILNIKEFCFCTPGVTNKSRSRGIEVAYVLNGGYDMTLAGDASDAERSARVSSVESFTAKIKIPLVNAESFKMLFGYEYDADEFNFSDLGSYRPEVFRELDEEVLRTSKFSLYMTKSFNDRFYALLRLRVAYNGDYDRWLDFSDHYETYNATAVFGVKKGEDREWGIGVSFSHNDIRTRLLPFAVYNRTFNDRWGIESVLPVQVYGRFNINQNNILLFGAQYSSRNFTINLGERTGIPEFYQFRNASIAPQISIEKHLFSWVWFSAKAGYQIPFGSEFINFDDDLQSIDVDNNGSFFTGFSIFLSPSRELYRPQPKKNAMGVGSN